MKSLASLASMLVLIAACGDTASPATGAATTGAPSTSAAPTSTIVSAATTTTAPAEPTTTVGQATTSAAVTTTTIDPNAPAVLEFSVSGGEVTGPDRVEVEKDTLVSVFVTSDVADEVHIHGYDIFADVGAGATVSLEFEASIQGIFEVELERSRTELFELVVS